MKKHTLKALAVFSSTFKLLLFFFLFSPQVLHAYPYKSIDIAGQKTKLSYNLNDSIPLFNKEKISVLKPDVPSLLEPDWSHNYHIPIDDYFADIRHPAGDLNGDGFDDLILVTNEYQISKFHIITYYGSSSGLPENPQSVIIRDTFPNWFLEDIMFNVIGDFNGDGYDDVCSNESFGKISIYLGSPAGLPQSPSFTADIPFGGVFYPKPVGDVNGDGYDDMVLMFQFQTDGLLIYGSQDESLRIENFHFPTEFEETDFVFHKVLYNDLNNDGFDDIIYHITYPALTENHFTIYYGSTEGLKHDSPQIISHNDQIEKVITGNFDGDGYGDIIYTTHQSITGLGYRYKLIELRGTSNGIEQDNAVIYDDYLGDGFWYGKYLSFLGDINNDGFDDFLYGNEVYLGSVFIPWLDPTVRFNSFKINHLFIEKLGDFNGDGSTDLGFEHHSGYVFYSSSYAPFNIHCSPLVEICYKGQDGYYFIPKAEFSNSHFSQFGHSIYEGNLPPRSENSSADDASGIYNEDALIIWYAIGYNKAQITCTTEVKFKHVPITQVTIKDAYAVTPGGKPNTIYVGHGPDGFRLAALPSGGGAPYTYLWSNGSTEKNPRITERVPGEYPYWVQMTNAHGCVSSDTVIVKVENALCSSPLVDAVMQSYPMILNNTILNNLIKSNSKVAVCKDGETLCLARSVVDIRLARPGYSLGPCTPGAIPATVFMTEEIEEILAGKLKVLVAPNPSSNRFQLNIASIHQEEVSIRITDISGRLVETVHRAATNSMIYIGEKLTPGMYFAEVSAGNERQVVKLIKLR